MTIQVETKASPEPPSLLYSSLAPHLIFCDCKSALCLPLIALYGKKRGEVEFGEIEESDTQNYNRFPSLPLSSILALLS